MPFTVILELDSRWLLLTVRNILPSVLNVSVSFMTSPRCLKVFLGRGNHLSLTAWLTLSQRKAVFWNILSKLQFKSQASPKLQKCSLGYTFFDGFLKVWWIAEVAAWFWSPSVVGSRRRRLKSGSENSLGMAAGSSRVLETMWRMVSLRNQFKGYNVDYLPHHPSSKP